VAPGTLLGDGTGRKAVSDSYAGFEQWYAECHPRVLGVLAAVSGNLDEAAEATDEAFARALARWQRVKAMRSPEAWTYKVALNVLRRRFRRRSRDEQFKNSVPTSHNPDLSLRPQLLEVLSALTRRQRTVLALVYVADLPQNEVARLLHVSRGTVASTIADAKAAAFEAASEPPALFKGGIHRDRA